MGIKLCCRPEKRGCFVEGGLRIMHSFESTLRRACAAIRPKRIIEWGPGRSTEIMHQECPAAAITSIEHHPAYFAAAAAAHGKYAGIVRLSDRGPKSIYAVWPLKMGGEYDLAFVDGRRRVECAMVAALCVQPGGLILIHDYHRWHYSRVVERFLRPVDGFSLDSMTGVFMPCPR
jgi:predicted O-methyltransferase YrrM